MYLFLSIRTYAFFTAAFLFLGSVKSLCKNLNIASCSAELKVYFLNNCIRIVFLPATVYQNNESKGYLLTLNKLAPISSAQAFIWFLESYQSIIEYFFTQSQSISFLSPFNMLTAYSLLIECSI